MDIGGKLRQARTQAQLTQEQAAEALGVSRQTISNWETEKTYPDIISVVRMSDLYAVSLDRLLKEEARRPDIVSEYVTYLEKSADAVRSRDRTTRRVVFSVCLLIWALCLVSFWCFDAGQDALGYSLTVLWLLMPVTVFAASVVLGADGNAGRMRWFAAPLMGILYMLTEYATFSAANMLTFSRWNAPQWGMVVAGTVISLFGIGLGILYRHYGLYRNKSGKKPDEKMKK